METEHKEKYKISLAAARVNAKLTQKQVADTIGVSPYTIINWESGKTSPTVYQMKMLCELYKAPIDVIFLPDSLLKVNKKRVS